MVPNHRSMNDGHCLIVPMQHVVQSTVVDEDVWDEIKVCQMNNLVIESITSVSQQALVCRPIYLFTFQHFFDRHMNVSQPMVTTVYPVCQSYLFPQVSGFCLYLSSCLLSAVISCLYSELP